MGNFVNASPDIIDKHWIGVISNLDNKVESTYSYETAKFHDFHHSYYMKPKDLEHLDNGESSIFFINRDDNTISGWRLDNNKHISLYQVKAIQLFFQVKMVGKKMMSESQVTNQIAGVNVHKKPGLDRETFLKDYSTIVFRPNTLSENEPQKKIIVCFPGRFQPYNKSHQSVLNMLYAIFGRHRVVILVSEYHNSDTDPLTYPEKKNLIMKANITLNARQIKPKRNLRFDVNTLAEDLGVQSKIGEYVLICVFSNEDDDLIPVKDKETYFQPWPQELYSASEEELNGLTKYLPSMDKYAFKIITDAIPSEINIIDKPMIKGIPKYLGMLELKHKLVDEPEDLQVKLPYDVEEILRYKKEIVKDDLNDFLDKKKLVNEEKVGSYMFDMNPLKRYTVYKNPQTTKRLMDNIRGIMAPSGDLYVVDYNINDGYLTHRNIIIWMNKNVKGFKGWTNKLGKDDFTHQYKDFFGIVESDTKGTFELAESYWCANMKQSVYDDFKKTINEYVNIFKEKHSQFIFKDIDWKKFDSQPKIKG